MDVLIQTLTTAVVVSVLLALWLWIRGPHLARPMRVRNAAALGFVIGLVTGGAGALIGLLLHALR